MSGTSEPAIRVFLSYAQADDVVLEFIKPFTTSLKHIVFADRGRTLDIFVDRESIGWGANWRESIRASIEGATIFMPIVTRQYFDRPYCREELLMFHGEASQLDVGALLLPVVIMGKSHLVEESPDVAVRIICARQCRDLQEAWLEGQQSSTWRRAIMALASELVDVADIAEQRLSATKMTSAVGVAGSHDDDDDAPGVAEVSEALEVFEADTEQLVGSLSVMMTSLIQVLSSFGGEQRFSNAELRQRISDAAALLEPYSLSFQEMGRKFESNTVQLDGLIRRYLRYLQAPGLGEMLASERAALIEGYNEETLKSLSDVEQVVSEFLVQIRPLEAGSAPLRRSLRGFRDGANAISGAIGVMLSWKTILD